MYKMKETLDQRNNDVDFIQYIQRSGNIWLALVYRIWLME